MLAQLNLRIGANYNDDPIAVFFFVIGTRVCRAPTFDIDSRQCANARRRRVRVGGYSRLVCVLSCCGKLAEPPIKKGINENEIDSQHRWETERERHGIENDLCTITETAKDGDDLFDRVMLPSTMLSCHIKHSQPQPSHLMRQNSVRREWRDSM